MGGCRDGRGGRGGWGGEIWILARDTFDVSAPLIPSVHAQIAGLVDKHLQERVFVLCCVCREGGLKSSHRVHRSG